MDEVLPYIDMTLVSLDSARPEWHDEIRGPRGMFDRVIEAVALANTRYPDISYQFNCCVQQGIADEIDDFLLLTEGMGLRISFDVITEFRHGEVGRAFTKTDMSLSPDELRRAGWSSRTSPPLWRGLLGGLPALAVLCFPLPAEFSFQLWNPTGPLDCVKTLVLMRGGVSLALLLPCRVFPPLRPGSFAAGSGPTAQRGLLPPVPASLTMPILGRGARTQLLFPTPNGKYR